VSNAFVIVFININNTAVDCLFMLVHGALTDVNKYNLWF